MLTDWTQKAFFDQLRYEIEKNIKIEAQIRSENYDKGKLRKSVMPRKKRTRGEDGGWSLAGHLKLQAFIRLLLEYFILSSWLQQTISSLYMVFQA